MPLIGEGVASISEEKIQAQQKNNIPIDSEWAGIISCDPSDIPDDITFSLSSVNTNDIPDDISLSLPSFDPDQSQDSLNVNYAGNNLTESDLSPEIELKEGKTVAGSQPNVGQKVFSNQNIMNLLKQKTQKKYIETKPIYCSCFKRLTKFSKNYFIFNMFFSIKLIY